MVSIEVKEIHQKKWEKEEEKSEQQHHQQRNVYQPSKFAPKHVECKLIKKNWKLCSAKYLLLLEQSFSIPDQSAAAAANLLSPLCILLFHANVFQAFPFRYTKYFIVCRMFYTQKVFSVYVCIGVFGEGWFILSKTKGGQNFIKVNAFSIVSSKPNRRRN